MAEGKQSGGGRKAGSKIDLATIAGLLIAVGGIVSGMILEGGNIKELLQPTAALIVFGGTLGAVLVTTPLGVLGRAASSLASVFFERSHSADHVIERIIDFATKARKNGIVSLEQDADSVSDPFLRKALNLAVDGTDLQEIRKMMELDMSLEEQRSEMTAKVFDSAGGYSPTIGIIGAVLGLIQVMKHLENINEVGRGIAVAFVATIYGVGAANILFLPAGSKIRARSQSSVQMKELMLEGVAGIVEGLNPKLIRTKLEAYGEASQPKKSGGRGRSSRAA
ncbi:MAG TPA: flagellar motor protein [Bryobacteraceae bacterium]|nr:flagellar motor protein [Bryobacteraceae bacterium]